MKAIHIANALQMFFYGAITFVFTIFLFPWFISAVKKFKLTQKIRSEDVTGNDAKLFAALHAHKSGTPTMGGVVMIVSVAGTMILSRALAYFGVIPYSILNRGETYLPLFTLIAVGGAGLGR